MTSQALEHSLVWQFLWFCPWLYLRRAFGMASSVSSEQKWPLKVPSSTSACAYSVVTHICRYVPLHCRFVFSLSPRYLSSSLSLLLLLLLLFPPPSSAPSHHPLFFLQLNTPSTQLAMKLLLPNLDRQRLAYGMKEVALAKRYTDILNIAKECSNA